MALRFGVLLLHGLTGVPSEMRPIEKHFQQLGLETSTPTLAGHGGTNEELLSARWKDWIKTAQLALDELSKRVDRVIICGLSMGASIGSILATRNQHVCGLIMLSPTLRYDSPELDEKWYLRAYKSKLVRDFVHVIVTAVPPIGKMMYWTEAPPYGLKDERLQRQITKAIEAAKQGRDTKFGLFRTYFISLVQMNHVTDEFKKTAEKLRCPVLVMSSLEDTLVSMNNAAETYRLIGTQDRSLVWITGCDHVMTLDLKRQFVAGLSAEFVQAISGLPLGQASDDMQFSIEVHNRINPLDKSDWSTLVPGGMSLSKWVQTLQEKHFHEQQCHVMVCRKNNIPKVVIPFAVNESERTMFIGADNEAMVGPNRDLSVLTETEWDMVREAMDALKATFS